MSTSHRHLPGSPSVAPLLKALAALTALVCASVTEGYAQSTPSIELSFDSERVEALFAGSNSVDVSDLLTGALSVAVGGGATGDVVLMAYRLRAGRVTADFRSEPFPPSDGLVAEQGALPEAGFYQGFADVARSGLSTTMPASPAREGTDNPVGFLVRNVLGGPTDGYTRDVIYAIVVPADEDLRDEMSAGGVVVFGDEPVTLDESTAGGGGETDESTSPSEIERALAGEQRCTGWVQDYTLYSRTPEGMVVPQYFIAHDGGPECRAVPITTYLDSMYIHAGMDPPRWPPEMAMAYRMLGEGLEQGMADEGFPLPVSILMEPMARFAEEASEVEPETLLQDDVEDRVADREDFIRRAELVGVETVDGRPANHYRAEGITDVWLGSAEGMSWELRAADLWTDVERKVQLGLRFEVYVETAEWGEGTIVIEKYDQGHFWTKTGVGMGAGFYYPRRQVMRIVGLTEMMPQEDRDRIDEALREIEQMKEQMEQMPPQAQSFLQAQINRLEAMTGRNGPSNTEAVIDILHVAMNEGPPYPGGVGEARIGDWTGGVLSVADWEPAYATDIEQSNVCGLRATTGDRAPLGFTQGDFLSECSPDLAYFLPTSLELDGWSDGNRRGWGNFEIDTERMFSYDNRVALMNAPQVATPDFVYLPGTFRGGYQTLEGEEEEVSGDAAMIITRLTPTQAWGWLLGDPVSASFKVGHMYCSTAPRVFNVNLAQPRGERVSPVERQLEATDTEGTCPSGGS